MAPHTWFDAARANNCALIMETVDVYARSVSDEGDTALILAAENNALDVAKVLIPREVCMVNKAGLTALMQAALMNCAETAELLAPLEANISMPDGRDAFMLASSRGNIEVMKVIHPYFALRTDQSGFSALDHAVLENREQAVKFILQMRVTTLKDLETALFLAVEKEYTHIHDLLREKSASLLSSNSRDSHRYDHLIRNPSLGNSFMQASTVSQTTRSDERAVSFSQNTSPRSSVATDKAGAATLDQADDADNLAITTLRNSNNLLRKENDRLKEQVKTLQEQLNASADIISVISATNSPHGNPFSVDSEILNRRAGSLRMPAESDTDDMDTLKRWYDQQLASERTRADALESKLRDYIKATKLDGGSDYLKIAISERDKVIAQLVHEFVDRMAELSLSGESDRSTTQLQKDIGDNVSSDVDVVLIENPHLKVLRSLLERLCGNMNKAYLSEGRKEAPEVLELSVARIRTPLDGSQELYPCAVEPVNRFGPHSSEQLYPQKLVETSDKSVETSTTDPVVTRNQQQPDSESCSLLIPDMTIGAIASREAQNQKETIPPTPVIDNFKGVEYYKELLKQKEAEIARLSLNTLAPVTVPEGDDPDALKRIIMARMHDIRCLIVENNQLEKDVATLKQELNQNDSEQLTKQLKEKEDQISNLQRELFNTIQLQTRPITIHGCTSEEHKQKLEELSRANDALARENARLSNALVTAKAGTDRDRLKELTNSNRILLDELHSKDEEIETLKMSMTLSESVVSPNTTLERLDALTNQLSERDATIQSLLESLRAQEEAFVGLQAVLRDKEAEVESMRNATISQERAVTHVITASQIQTNSARNSRTLSPILYREDDETLTLRKSLRTTTAELSSLKEKLSEVGLLEDGSLDIKALKASTKRIGARLSIDDKPAETERISKCDDFSQKFVGIADESPFIDVKK
ncbi:Ankyrin repeat protein 1 [Giardia duodenalis]|uniref:Ankyrin repeat protein 1 n=1 Tax=Giardia intestinalis (strain ATCC 50803 / WB clone C6) TaxID=184922 RepID=A8BBW8_GIAIC|nr:Ankyrin repeat protein 1 [Giardia intestinalis]KAE8305223.1 Ankyrin repeat protein 1 [Giardia intestinalis]|eukprot:XP_001708084.1 Spindle pole protein, putative [Giardia lamblia ATCC 50803]